MSDQTVMEQFDDADARADLARGKRYTITPPVGAYGSRLWVELAPGEHLPSKDAEIRKHCMWGGADKRGSNFVAYEFDSMARMHAARAILSVAGYVNSATLAENGYEGNWMEQ